MAQLLPHPVRDLLILLHQVIQLLCCHCAVRHHGEDIPLYGLAQLLLIHAQLLAAAQGLQQEEHGLRQYHGHQKSGDQE